MVSARFAPTERGWKTLLATLAAALTLLADVQPGLAQEPEDVDEEPPSQDAPAPKQQTTTPFRLWSAELALAAIRDSNFQRDEDELDRQGLSLAAVVRYQNRAARPSFRLEYAAAVRETKSAETSARRRVSHKLQASYESRFDDRWSLETSGIVSEGIVTTEFSLADDYVLMPRLIYRPSGRRRYRLFAAYRIREYRDAGGSRAQSPFAGIDYRHLVRRGEYWEIGYRYEVNRADIARFDFTRSTFNTSYTFPFWSADRIRLGLSYRDELYENTAVPGPQGVARNDEKWVISALWTHPLRQRMLLQIGYNYRTRHSNDPGRDFESNRLSAKLRFQW